MRGWSTNSGIASLVVVARQLFPPVTALSDSRPAFRTKRRAESGGELGLTGTATTFHQHEATFQKTGTRSIVQKTRISEDSSHYEAAAKNMWASQFSFNGQGHTFGAQCEPFDGFFSSGR